MFGVYKYWIDVAEFKKIYINIVTLTFDLEIQGQTWHSAINMLSLGVYIEKLVFGIYNHQTEVMELEVSTIYTSRDIILNALRHVWRWFSKSKVKVTILIYLFEFRDIDFVLIDTKHTFQRYILSKIYHFESVTSCLTLNVKVKSQGHDIDIYIFEFRDIDLVLIDTKHKFLRYILPKISDWMRYVIFDLVFQGQKSRSGY